MGDNFGAVLVIDTDEGFLTAASELLDGDTGLVARSMSDAKAMVDQRDVSLVIIGPSYGHEAGIGEGSLLLDADPDLPIILVSENSGMDVLRAALRAGYKDVIDAPLTSKNVEDAMATIARKARRGEVAATPKSTGGKVITIMSPKGGAGKTMVSTNVSVSLSQWTDPGSVCVMDADLQFGDICISLQIEPRHTIVDIARDLDQLDESLMDSLLAKHPSGLRVLSAPLEPSLADEVSTQVVVKSLAMLKSMFDYVVVDTAPFLDEPVLSILERSDHVLLVVDMDLPSVKNAKLALDTLRLIKFPFEKIQLVLNRVNSKARLDVGELERSLGLDVKAAISSDKLVPRAVNEGEPVVSLYPRSRVARDLRGVARLVAGDVAADEPADEKGRRWFK
ncbi:MAG: AAA family ATPase [Acidimicrobiia bacterium]|nr:AAA family ATPase [Acidimicrobiia bacterium]